ncbi:MAG: hypothetical protein TREMPRED_002171 [Tremellales sp. Tagirdzhanova-0007]|nr:MAG: hypothetical protein TREMPRED_002171 [Tremellales sp. Tagirdzhanova-0007]
MVQRLPVTPLAYPVPALPPNSVFESPELKHILDELSKYCPGAKPLGWENRWTWEMPVVHIMILDLLKRVYAFADWAVEHDDLPNYLGNSEISVFQVHKHHQLEETKIFPQWAAAAGLDVWTRNVEQHHLFSEALEATWLYLRKCRENLSPTPLPSPVPEPDEEINSIDLTKYGLDPTKPFSPTVLRAHMDTWVLVLAQHLLEEIDTLKPELMKKIGEKELKAIDAVVVKSLQAYDPSWFLSSFMASVHPNIRSVLVPLPYIVTWFLVPFVWSGKNWGFWRYCPYPEVKAHSPMERTNSILVQIVDIDDSRPAMTIPAFVLSYEGSADSHGLRQSAFYARDNMAEERS